MEFLVAANDAAFKLFNVSLRIVPVSSNCFRKDSCDHTKYVICVNVCVKIAQSALDNSSPVHQV